MERFRNTCFLHLLPRVLPFIPFLATVPHTIPSGTVCVAVGSIYIWWPDPSVCPSRKSNSYKVFHLDRAITYDSGRSWGLFSLQGTELRSSKHQIRVVAHLSQCWWQVTPAPLCVSVSALCTCQEHIVHCATRRFRFTLTLAAGSYTRIWHNMHECDECIWMCQFMAHELWSNGYLVMETEIKGSDC